MLCGSHGHNFVVEHLANIGIMSMELKDRPALNRLTPDADLTPSVTYRLNGLGLSFLKFALEEKE